MILFAFRHLHINIRVLLFFETNPNGNFPASRGLSRRRERPLLAGKTVICFSMASSLLHAYYFLGIFWKIRLTCPPKARPGAALQLLKKHRDESTFTFF